MTQITSLAGALRAAPWRLSLLHGAPVPRMIWITHGQARVLLGPRMRGTGANTVLFLPPRAPFALDAGTGLNGHLVTAPTALGGLWPATALMLRIADADTQNEGAALFDALLREQNAARPLLDAAMTAHLQLLSIWLARVLERPEAAPPRETAADRLSSTFLTDLELNHPSGDTMATYARRLGVTPTHLTRVCKSQLGHSAADLIADRTLYAARELLETTRHPAKSIAQGLGFGSAASFSRFVHARAGHSPMALRKAARAAAPVHI